MTSKSGLAQELTKKNVSHNAGIFSEKVSRAPWKEMSTAYVYYAKDMAIFLELQKSLVRDARENGTANLVTATCDSDISFPEWVYASH
jgi:hypothetical protein